MYECFCMTFSAQPLLCTLESVKCYGSEHTVWAPWEVLLIPELSPWGAGGHLCGECA